MADSKRFARVRSEMIMHCRSERVCVPRRAFALDVRSRVADGLADGREICVRRVLELRAIHPLKIMISFSRHYEIKQAKSNSCSGRKDRNSMWEDVAIELTAIDRGAGRSLDALTQRLGTVNVRTEEARRETLQYRDAVNKINSEIADNTRNSLLTADQATQQSLKDKKSRAISGASVAERPVGTLKTAGCITQPRIERNAWTDTQS